MMCVLYAGASTGRIIIQKDSNYAGDDVCTGLVAARRGGPAFPVAAAAHVRWGAPSCGGAPSSGRGCIEARRFPRRVSILQVRFNALLIPQRFALTKRPCDNSLAARLWRDDLLLNAGLLQYKTRDLPQGVTHGEPGSPERRGGSATLSFFKVAFSTFRFKFGATLRRQAERRDSGTRQKASNLAQPIS